MFVYFRRHRNLSVTLTNLEIDMAADEEGAQVRAVALVTGAESLLPDAANLYRVESDWHQVGDHWRFYRISWRSASQ